MVRAPSVKARMSDPLQFEAFMRDYQNMVFSTAYRLLADRAEAEDISQEVFLKAYTHFGDLQHSPTVGGWLKTVTRNLCLSHLTRRRWRLLMAANGRLPALLGFALCLMGVTVERLKLGPQLRLRGPKRLKPRMCRGSAPEVAPAHHAGHCASAPGAPWAGSAARCVECDHGIEETLTSVDSSSGSSSSVMVASTVSSPRRKV